MKNVFFDIILSVIIYCSFLFDYIMFILIFFFFFLGNELHHTVFHDNKRLNKQIRNDEASLKVFKLGHNNIHSLPPDCFEYLTNLEVLELNNNPLLVIDQNTEISLGYLTKLQVGNR